jgi:molybdopterin-containing oxidoreductase family iron-sulfur binding subunit
VSVRPPGAHERLPKTEGHRRQMGRGIAQAVTLAAMEHGEAHPSAVQHAAEPPEREERLLEEVAEMQHEATQYGPYAYEQERWAMAIDLAKCTGCSACVVACSAENNVPHVGEEQVRRGRELQWIRIERYFEGGEDGEPLESRFVPMLCQQCGNAPCEPVCPVYATYRTPDGLNAQVYNRCVGVRYCSNNCPYKVRTFNWFDYSTPKDPRTFAWPEPMHWLLNPDVVVRPKGIMEKCTFCIQRIRGAQNQAKLSGTPLGDGDVVTACQQTCPADAIVFGDLSDPDAKVRSLVVDERGYKVLDGLNTKPAVTYLTRVRNLAEA